MFEKLLELSNKVNSLLWFDTADGVELEPKIIPIVDGYYKKQLPKNKYIYLKPGFRQQMFTEYYCSNYKISDVPNRNKRLINDKSYLDKINLFWNIGMNIQFPLSGKVFSNIPNLLLYRFPWQDFINKLILSSNPYSSRTIDISARFSTEQNEAVRLHRQLMLENVGYDIKDSWVNIIDYWRELRNAKLVLSPFGWGEICRRDVEAFSNGAAVIKPHMSHLRTWPPWYDDKQTIFSVKWDMSDISQTVQYALNNPEERRRIAKNGQDRYQRYMASDEAAELFVEHFAQLLDRHY
jgi:hypothetical protein